MTSSLLPYCVPLRWDFSFGNRFKSEGAISGEYVGWGWISNPHLFAAVMATCDVWAGALSCTSQFSSPLSCDFLAQTPQFACIICTIYRSTLFKIINHDHPLTIPKDWGLHLPCSMNPLKFLRRGWAKVLPLLALHFWLWVKVVNPYLIMGYNSLDKIARIIFIARQEIPRNIERSPFLIIGQHSQTHLCRNLWHT